MGYGPRGLPVAGNALTLGKLIAKARRRKGWPQRDVAAMLDKSESWLSQVERDVIPVNRLETLRSISDALDVPLPELLAATPPPAQSPTSAHRRPASTRVGRNLGPEEGDDLVRRRELLAAAAAVFASPLASATPAEASTLAPLEDLLLYGTAAVPEDSDVSPAGVAAAVKKSRAHFRAARYDALARTLPGQIARAQALQPAETAATAVAYLYNIAARLCIKLGEDGLVAITADRALNSARVGGNALTIAESHRMVSSAWRRQGHLARATDIAVRGAQTSWSSSAPAATPRGWPTPLPVSRWRCWAGCGRAGGFGTFARTCTSPPAHRNPQFPGQAGHLVPKTAASPPVTTSAKRSNARRALPKENSSKRTKVK